MMDTQNRQEAFQRAWTDLDERMLSAVRNLTANAERAIDEQSHDRLVDKRSGVEFGLDLWKDLNAGAMGRTGDYAGMWRTFTEQMSARLNEAGYQFGYYQGVHLVLTYQRGYGADVDAPVILNPHVR
jgi:hypothetical protein